MINKIIIVTGDPNSINSEILCKSWRKINNQIKKNIYVISNYELFKKQMKRIKCSIKIQKVKKINELSNSKNLKLIDINLNFSNPFKVPVKAASLFVNKSLNFAHSLALKNNNIAGIINCAIDKKLLKRSKIGVTEYLASKCKIRDNSEVMLIRNKKLSVSPVTTHIDLKDVSKKLNAKTIINKIRTIDHWFRKKINKKPKIGILGLNPHNAELRKNSVEVKIIMPTIKKLKKLGFRAEGPLVADTVFINKYKNYDVIVGMYHDQVITPFKSIFKFDAINVTLGLKYLRVSPDHGTAINLIGKNKADSKSLVECINFINKFGK